MLEREVAVKLMRKELAEDTKSLESFYREARACAALNHTNIIHIYTFDEFDGQIYLVMELADRGSLDQRIEQRTPSARDVSRKTDCPRRASAGGGPFPACRGPAG